MSSESSDTDELGNRQAVAERLRRSLARRLPELSLDQLRRIHEFLAPQWESVPTGEPSSTGDKVFKWPHAPTHKLSDEGTWIVTAATYRKQHLFRGPDRLSMLCDQLLSHLQNTGWRLEAWAVFSNHYHFVAHASVGGQPLSSTLNELHWRTAEEINATDSVPGRKVWHNFWDTQLTYLSSFHARLHYVHQNPVRHGLVKSASQYPWCSAYWFENTASPSQVKTIYGYRIDRVQVFDDFETVM
jgi:putative transposase